MTTAANLITALRRHYIPETADLNARDGGLFAHEVGINGDWGARGTRRADALYAGFTSASGRILVGHEVKVSRADWRNELDKAGKADAWADACHAWYIVAPSTDVVPPEELPHGWGLMLPPKTARGRRMQIAVRAQVKEDHTPPWWATRSFMARFETLAHQQRAAELLRREAAIRAELEKQYKERAEPSTHVDYDREAEEKFLAEVRELMGLDEITRWRDDLDSGKASRQTVAAALRLAAALQGGWQIQTQLRQVKDIQEFAADIAPALQGLADLHAMTKKEG